MAQIKIEFLGKNVTVNYPDAMVGTIPNAFAKQYKRPDKVFINGAEVDNPISKEDFAVQKIVDYVKDVVRAYSVDSAVEQAKTQAKTAADAAIQSITTVITNSGE